MIRLLSGRRCRPRQPRGPRFVAGGDRRADRAAEGDGPRAELFRGRDEPGADGEAQAGQGEGRPAGSPLEQVGREENLCVFWGIHI